MKERLGKICRVLRGCLPGRSAAEVSSSERRQLAEAALAWWDNAFDAHYKEAGRLATENDQSESGVNFPEGKKAKAWAQQEIERCGKELVRLRMGGQWGEDLRGLPGDVLVMGLLVRREFLRVWSTEQNIVPNLVTDVMLTLWSLPQERPLRPEVRSKVGRIQEEVYGDAYRND